ncbi:MAG: M48 family metallopeptidase [Deltaproteobacteria bacterium]|nr:M48 family metallopeptidase [Deltaproteobacteria bacterium]
MIAAERSVVQYGRTQIPYQVRRSSRRATVSVAVDPGLGVLLTAPEDVAVSRLDRLVHRKASWIVERLRMVGRLHAPQPAREFVSGESVLYLGRHYRLRVLPAVEPGPARMDCGWLVVAVTRGGGPVEAAREASEGLRRWLIGRAAQRLPERVEVWRRKVGVPMPAVVVKDQRKRWGSCDQRGVVRFNWRIIQAPMRLVDYVVAHELCHLVHKDHSRAYWSLLGRVLPDYDERRAELMAFGPRADW